MAARHDQRQALRALEREIATYTSKADPPDLQAAVGRSGAEADHVREILDRHMTTLSQSRLRAP